MRYAWTDERVELLRKLWADGLSASQVAAEFGSITRCAVLGKVRRLGLSELPRLEREKPVRKAAEAQIVKPLTVAAEARIHGVRPETVYERMSRGMSREEALMTPVRGHHRAEEDQVAA